MSGEEITPLPLEAFIRICEMARMRLGSGETEGLVLSEHRVPADSESLLTLARSHTFIYVTVRQKESWSTPGVLTRKKYKSDLTRGKRSLRQLHGNRKDITCYFSWSLSCWGKSMRK